MREVRSHPIDNTAGCAGCGRCCDPVDLPTPVWRNLQAWSTEAVGDRPDPLEEWDFWAALGWPKTAQQHLHDLWDPNGKMRYNADFAAKYWTRRNNVDIPPLIARLGLDIGVPIRCAAYDPVHRRCTAHAIRPSICSGFPWYDHNGDPLAGVTSGDRAMPYSAVEQGPEGAALGCSYLRDLPPEERPAGVRPLIPLEVL